MYKNIKVQFYTNDVVSTEETDQPIPTATKSFKHAMKYIQLCLWGNN